MKAATRKRQARSTRKPTGLIAEHLARLNNEYREFVRRQDAILREAERAKRAGVKELSRKQEAAEQVVEAAEMCRKPFATYAELRDLFASTLSMERPNPPPNTREVNTAREKVLGELNDVLEDESQPGRLIEFLPDGSIAIKPGVDDDGKRINGFAVLQRIILRDYVAPQLEDAEPTTAPPGSPRKVEIMRERVEGGCETFAEGDADMTNAFTVERANGTGKKVLEILEGDDE
jgi:hypothetical protein